MPHTKQDLLEQYDRKLVDILEGNYGEFWTHTVKLDGEFTHGQLQDILLLMEQILVDMANLDGSLKGE